MPDKEDLESRLRAALTAGEPSAGFAARTAARAVRPATPPTIRRPTRWLWAAAVVALMAATVLGVGRYRQQRQEAAAARQLQTALAFTNAQVSHITDVALRHATQHFEQETP